MMKLLGGLMLLGGFIGFILSAIADYIGLSIRAPTEIGWFQMTFIVLGIVILIIGVFMMILSSRVGAEAELPEDEEGEIEAEEYECPSCGATVSAEATACTECGEVFEREEFECPSCGAIVEPDAKSCPECGEEFEAEGEEVAPVPGPEIMPVEEPMPEPEPEVEEEEEEEGIEEEEEYECPSCGAGVKEDDTSCPNCGEDFE
jgi:RNA polymerase subunit RPABC4/transcription elongation factor Spt4